MRARQILGCVVLMLALLAASPATPQIGGEDGRDTDLPCEAMVQFIDPNFDGPLITRVDADAEGAFLEVGSIAVFKSGATGPLLKIIGEER